MAAMRLEQVQRFILAKKIFWGCGHFKICFSRIFSKPRKNTFELLGTVLNNENEKKC